MARVRAHAAPITVAVLTVSGLVLRVVVMTESLLADELSTYWIVSSNGISGVWSTVHGDAEITPPLYFLAAWLATQFDSAPELTRFPSLLAGVATIPVVYLLGLRTVGRTAAVTGAAVVALSPFTIYYSAEARGYALVILLVALSTLAMLLAADRHRPGWWAIYAVASCAAMLTHYTAAFPLAAQLAWLLWAESEARRPALIANVCAAVAFLPWLSGLQADLESPTTEILSALSPFDVTHIRISITHATVGYPYQVVGLRVFPGVVPLILFAVGAVLGIVGLVRSSLGQRLGKQLAAIDPRVVLVVVVAASVPLGTAFVSLVGTNLFSTRNLAASWPGYALTLGALLVAAGPRMRPVAIGCVLACLGIASLELVLGHEARRLDFTAAGRVVDREARPGDVVVDAAPLTPGPISPLDVALRKPHPIIRSGAPIQRVRPFAVFDRVIPDDEVIRHAVHRAKGKRIFLVGSTNAVSLERDLVGEGYRLVRRDRFPGFAELQVQIWER